MSKDELALEERDELVDEQRGATVLDVSPLTLRDWRRQGRGPAHYRIGRLVRYRLRDLESFLEACRRDAGVSR